ncbi:MAG: hypothetical protein KME26_24495 [Oscillatoria princeps RMCB-10]|jgi:hypothetical protein|nr:hypothetical protein [Oscillatoria princeps RMCB-10]
MMHRSARVCLNQLNQGKQQIVKAFFRQRLEEIQDCRHLFWQRQALSANLADKVTAHRGFQRLGLTGRLFRSPAQSASEWVVWERARFEEGLKTGKPKTSAKIRGKAFDSVGLGRGSSRSKLSVTPVFSAKATRGFLARVWERARTAPREWERQEGRFAGFSKELPRPTLKRFGRSVGLEYDRKNGRFFSGARLAWQKIGQQIQAFENRQTLTHAEMRAGVKKVRKRVYLTQSERLDLEQIKGVKQITCSRRAGVFNRRRAGWLCASAAGSLSGRGQELEIRLEGKKSRCTSQFCRTGKEWEKLKRVGKKCLGAGGGETDRWGAFAAKN